MQGQNVRELVESLGPEKFYMKACELLNEKKLSADDFSYYELAEACGVLPRLRSVRESMTGERPALALLRESNPGVTTHLFQVMTGELIGRKVIEGYENTDGFIGDRLVTVIPSSLRNQKLAGFRDCSVVKFQCDLSQPELYGYSLTLHADDPVMHAEWPGT